MNTRSSAHKLSLLASLAASIAGCGSPPRDSCSIEQLRREFDALRSNNERLEERVNSLEFASVRQIRPSATESFVEDRPRDIEVVRLSPSSHDGDVRRVDDAIEEGVVGVGDADRRTLIRVDGNRPPVVRHGVEGVSVRSDAQAMREYERAYKLVAQKQYEDALNGLAGFLVRYPGHAMAESAMYWRGECYFALGNYVRAAEQYEGVVARFPGGSKAPEALLKLGTCQRRLGDVNRAEIVFDILRSSYPSSDAAQKIPKE